MDTVHIRPTWLTALFPLLAVWQYGDRSVVRAELLRMALSADAAARSAEALSRIANMLDRDGHAIEMHRDELRAIARAALSEFDRVPPRAPLPTSADTDLYHAFRSSPADAFRRAHHA